MKIISPQLFLVDRIPCHVKDLCTRPSLTKSEEDFDNTSESGAESLLLEEENTVWQSTWRWGWSRAPLSVFAKKNLLQMTIARLPSLWSWDRGGGVMREMTYRGFQSEHEHVSYPKCCQERKTTILGGTICRMPVLTWKSVTDCQFPHFKYMWISFLPLFQFQILLLTLLLNYLYN